MFLSIRARRYSRLALLVPALIATPLTCLTVTCLPAIDSQILVTSYCGGTTWAPPLIGLCASADKARASAAPTPQRAGVLHIARECRQSICFHAVYRAAALFDPKGHRARFSVILSAAPFPRASCARLCACGPSSSRQCTPCAFHLAYGDRVPPSQLLATACDRLTLTSHCLRLMPATQPRGRRYLKMGRSVGCTRYHSC
jgi:hypothetical protein